MIKNHWFWNGVLFGAVIFLLFACYLAKASEHYEMEQLAGESAKKADECIKHWDNEKCKQFVSPSTERYKSGVIVDPEIYKKLDKILKILELPECIPMLRETESMVGTFVLPPHEEACIARRK